MIQSTTKGFEFSTNFLYLFRQPALLKSHFVKSRVIGPPSHRPSASELSRRIVHTSTKPISVSVDCCRNCFCCPQLEALLDFPCASSILPAVRRLHQSFRSPVTNTVLQVAVVQVAVALAEAVTPSRCHCHCYLLPRAAQEVAPLRPQGDVSCAQAHHSLILWRPEQNDRNSGVDGGKGTASCGCNTSALIPTLPPSSSSAFGVNSLPSASSSKLPVHRSPCGNRLMVRAFTSTCGANKQRVRSIHQSQVPSLLKS